MTRQEREHALAHLPSCARAAFVAVCASKMMPFVRRCAQLATADVADAAVEALWRAAAGEIDPARMRELIALIESAPESEVEDSAAIEYNAGEALAVLYYSLRSVAGNEAKDAISAARRTIELHSVLDYVESAEWPRARIVNPENPPPPGVRESVEIKDQENLLVELAGASTSLESLRLRTQATLAAADQAVAGLVTKWKEWLLQRSTRGT